MCPFALRMKLTHNRPRPLSNPLSLALHQVTAASLTSTGCPEGWLYSDDTDHCYFKSPNTAKAADQADAVSKCEAEGAWVIAINSKVRVLPPLSRERQEWIEWNGMK